MSQPPFAVSVMILGSPLSMLAFRWGGFLFGAYSTVSPFAKRGWGLVVVVVCVFQYFFVCWSALCTDCASSAERNGSVFWFLLM